MLSLSVPFLGCTQTVLQVANLPTEHPSQETIYVAGNFNGWQPGSPKYALQLQADGTYSITLPYAQGDLMFKFTRGSWETEEVNAQGQVMENRRLAAGGTHSFVIAGWKDQQGSESVPKHTASERVKVWQEALPMPQLDRTRRIWVYLPKGYEENLERYPVLYMHDGQNLFDAATSFSGEWGVDEWLDSLQLPLIVVGIDNGGDKRIDEYTPYPNEKYGGGEGEAYLDFVVETLKPQVDSAFRTHPTPAHTGIMGSSLGGLISLCAELFHPGVFDKLGLFSTSLWINHEQTLKRVAAHDWSPETRAYFLVGAKEGGVMVSGTEVLANDLRGGGLVNVAEVVDEQGEHTESFWRQYFGEAIRFLYPELFE